MENNKDTVVSKTTEKNANKKSKPGFLKRIGDFFVRTWGKIKEVFSELKKVTWPTFPTAMKQLGCVLVTVVLILVIITCMDLGLQQLLKLVRGV